MGTSKGMLDAARASLGLVGRPNYITRDYASRHGSDFLDVAWCDMGVTYWARKSDNRVNILPAGDRAFTPWHANDFVRLNEWHEGTVANIKKYARPGMPVLFDWGGSNNPPNVDHIGVIEEVLSDGRIQTIEANTSNRVARRVRSANVIAGFGGVIFAKPSPSTPHPYPFSSTRYIKRGWTNSTTVERIQKQANLHGAALKVDGDFGAKTEAWVYKFQKTHHLQEDGVVGPKTWAVLFN